MTHADAFGDALIDHLDGGTGEHVIERDDGLVEPFSDVEMYFRDSAEFPPVDSAAIELLRGRVLDVGAGAGRFSLAAQALGLAVTALDDSAGAVAVCRERGVVDVAHASFHAFEPDVAYDTFLMMGNNLGLLAPDPVRSLGRIRSMANPGARVVGVTLDPYATEDPAHLAYHEANRRRGRRGGHVVLRVRRRTLIGPWFDYLYSSEPELAEIAGQAGWELDIIERDGGQYLAALTTS